MNNKLHYIHPRFFIGMFFICPVLLIVTLVDKFLLESMVLNWLPTRPEKWAFWLIIFSLPHIISSFITMFDTDNIVLYKKKIIKAIILLVGLSFLFNLIIPNFLANSELYNYQLIFFAIYGFFTVYHVTSQQLGIGLILSRLPPDLNFSIFKWLSIFLAFVLFLLVVFSSAVNEQNAYLVKYGHYISGVLLVICCHFGWALTIKTRLKQGKIYIYLNLMMFGSIFIFAIFDYFIFALIVPRVIHDITAFVIYSNHDANKFTIEKNHLIYAILLKTPISIRIASPVLGVLIALIIKNSPAWFILYSMLVFDFLHYYIESFIWKKEGSHRKYLKIK